MRLASFTWLAGFALIFVGERMFGGGEDKWRWILDGTGALALVATLGLILSARSAAPQDQRAPYGLGLAFAAVGLSSLLLYAGTGDAVLDGLALEAQAEDRLVVALQALSCIAWLAGTLPLLSVLRALALSPVRSIARLVREGALSALAVAFALAMLFPLNYLASEHNTLWDLGYFKTAQVGSRTLGMVEALEEPLRVVTFFPTGSAVQAEIKGYFGAIPGDRLQVEHVDHALEPGLSEQLKVRGNGYIAFVKGEQVERVKVGEDLDDARRKLKTLDEEVQKALAKVARGQATVYLTVGHGELYWKGDDKARKINTFKTVLSNLNYRVKELGLAEGLGTAVPDDAAAVIVLGPTEPFLAEELATLEAYRQRGGRLMISLEPGGSDLSALLGPLGIQAGMAGPLAADNYYLKVTGGPGDQLNQVSNKFSAHPSVTTLSKNSKQLAVAFPGVVPLDFDAEAGAKVQATIRTLPAVWQDLDGDYAFDDGAEERKQWQVGLAASGEPTSGELEYRVVVYGDANWASDLFLPYSGNAQLLVDALGWLVEDPALQGETESEEDVKIQHTKEGQGLWFYGSALFVPMGLLALGLGRLGLRRRRHGRS